MVNFFCHLGSSVYELRDVSRAAWVGCVGDVLVYLERRQLGMLERGVLTWYCVGMGMYLLRCSVEEDMAESGAGDE